MESPRQHRRHRRKVREEKRPACEACRSMKLRCDAFTDYSRPCSRCVKKGIECTVLEARRKKQSADAPPSISSNGFDMSTVPQLTLEPRTVPASFHDPIIEYCSAPRIINGIEVSPSLIDTCFNLFNCHYSPIMPILSSVPTPDQTFRESELKFWVIVAIGSRKCTQDPTLFSQLSTHVENLAMSSLRLTTSPYPVIEALLLICTWHISNDRPFFSGIYLTFASAVLPLALQAGLHHCWHLRPTFRDGDLVADPDGTRGTKLWAYSSIINQSAMISSGLTVMDMRSAQHFLQGRECCASLPQWLIHRGRTIGAISRMQRALSEIDLDRGEMQNDIAIKSLITTMEFELVNWPMNRNNKDSTADLHTAIALLNIRATCLFMTEINPDNITLANLFAAAISVVEMVDGLNISEQWPYYVFEVVVLAAAVLLRLVKGMPPGGLDQCSGKTALFAAINIFKSMSIVNNDVPARVAGIFTKLWSSNQIFRNSKGDYDIALHVRNRLIVSVSFDCFWWYRKVVVGWPSSVNTQESDTREANLDGVQNFLDDDFFSFWGFDWATGVASPGDFPDPQYVGFSQEKGSAQ